MFYLSLILVNLILISIFEGCRPVREFMTWKKYDGANEFEYKKLNVDKSKKTVLIIADNEGTEIFDLLTPFYLFNATEKANVIIAAPKKYPIILRKGLFVLPQMSFSEFDAAKITPDVIVIPNLSAMTAKKQNPEIINWIKKHYGASVKMLSVCDGALTAAATGIYDNKFLTTHASDYEDIKNQFAKPNWIKDTSVTQSGNLYSTAGVSNAVEGSLTVIKDLFGAETMLLVKAKIRYPHAAPLLDHKSVPVGFKQKLSIGNKIFFKGNKRIGVLLQDSTNEFDLAAILDTYNRTFPKSIESYSLNNKTVTSKYGLVMIPTAAIWTKELDEIHIPNCFGFDADKFKSFDVVTYDNSEQGYIINSCLGRIEKQYGIKFRNVVKLLLDYN